MSGPTTPADLPPDVAAPATSPTTIAITGGVPLSEPVLIWWNFVVRTRDEMAAAHADWTAGGERFGRVESPLPRIEVGPPPWSRR